MYAYQLVVFPLIATFFATRIAGCCICNQPVIRIGYPSTKENEERYVEEPNSWIQSSILELQECPPSFTEFIQSRLGEFMRKIASNPKKYLTKEFLKAYPIKKGNLVGAERQRVAKNILRAVAKVNQILVTHRDAIWNQLLRTSKRPGKSLVIGLTNDSFKIIFNILSRKFGTRALQELMSDHAAYYLMPHARIWHEADPNYALPIKKVFSNWPVDVAVIQYLRCLATFHNKIQRGRGNEERLRNPYALGDHVVVSFVNYYFVNKKKTNLLLLRSMAPDADLLKAELGLILHFSGRKRPKTRTVEQNVKVLVRDRATNLLKVVGRVDVPWKSTGSFQYPSPMMLREEIKELLHKEGVLEERHCFYYPIEKKKQSDLESSSSIQSESLLLNLLPADTLALIAWHAQKVNSDSNLTRTCTFLHSLQLPPQTSSNPASRAKEMTVMLNIPRSRIAEFLYASAITMTLRGTNTDQDSRKDTISTLALFLYHSYPLHFNSIDMLKDLEKGKQFPAHLTNWIRSVDFSIFKELRTCLIAIRKGQMTIVHYDTGVSEERNGAWEYLNQQLHSFAAIY